MCDWLGGRRAPCLRDRLTAWERRSGAAGLSRRCPSQGFVARSGGEVGNPAHVKQVCQESSLASGQLCHSEELQEPRADGCGVETGKGRGQAHASGICGALYPMVPAQSGCFHSPGPHLGGLNFPSVRHQLASLPPASLTINWTRRSPKPCRH